MDVFFGATFLTVLLALALALALGWAVVIGRMGR